ncbi:MAG: nucleotidyltransferase domain-containing protein, partial [Candidatus Woesearchaeota archaeon]
MQHVIDKVLQKIKPSAQEVKKFDQATKQFLAKLNPQLKDAQAILGGSGEKDTWLSTSHDIDIFVQFEYKEYKDKSLILSDLLEEKLKRIFPNIKRLHGSRDYFQINYLGYDFEVVPILNVT